MIEKGRVVNHPGVYIKDALDELGISQSEFAYRTGISIKNVSTVITGASNITFDVAIKLAAFFGNSAEGWINLQTKYDAYLELENRKKEYEEDWKIASYFNKDFINSYLHIAIDKNNKEETIDKLRKCFSVVLLKNLNQPNMYAFYKTSIKKDINEKTIILRNAWISLADAVARNITCSSFDKEKIISNQQYLRSLTLLKPDEFSVKLKEFLNGCGVKLVILPYLSGSNVSGVTKWISNESAVMIAINDCGKDADRIWFTIFHELGHAIKNHKRHMTISYEKDKIIDQEELEANTFAMNLLINPDDYYLFTNHGNFDLDSIIKFAKEQNVADFIVIGRLQKDGYIPYTQYQEKKTKYQIRYS